MATRALAPDYPNKLRELIKDVQNGILIDARKKISIDGSRRHAAGAAFRLPGKPRLQREYIVVAGLFRNRKWFDECADQLAAFARPIIGDTRSIALATCTATARHLMEHLHARLSGDPTFKAYYHGPYPLDPGRNRHDYNGRNVLLVTDVVASGALCADLAEAVESQGGVVSGVLALIATKDAAQKSARTTVSLRNRTVPLFSLCDFPVTVLGPNEVDPAEIEEISPETILRRLIADPENGMLIDAREHDKLNSAPGKRAENPVFELTSGHYQRQFVTAWGIFDKPWYFEPCMDYLSKLAREIRSQSDGWFSVIVTCTATGHHLMEHLQARIETAEDPVKVHYLGPFPFHGLRNRGLDLKNQPVLIVTDVIAQGRMAGNIMAVVAQLKGRPVAVMSLVGLVRDEHQRPRGYIECKELAEQDDDSPEYDQKLSIPAYYLTTYCIPAVTKGFDKIYRIDPNTILPVEAPLRNGFEPLIDRQESLRQFEDSQALKIGLYSAGPRFLTAAFRISRLLEHSGPAIWLKIKEYFSATSVLVTTFGKEDVTFRSFVEKQAAGDWNSLDSVFIPRSDSIHSDFPYFVTGDIRRRLEGQSVVLLLSSLQTSEKLRKLVALLAQSGVEKITVVCLLNRMGVRTVEFVSRIERMIQGLGKTKRSMNFTFRYVYEVRDLHGEPLRRTIETIDWLATQYSASTSEQSYQSLTEQEVARYLRTSSMAGREFAEQTLTAIPADDKGEIVLGKQTWNYRTVDGKVYAIFNYVAQKREAGDIRDYTPVVTAIAGERQRPVLYTLYTILLSDISYLRLAGLAGKLRDILMESVRVSRRERMERERMERERKLIGESTREAQKKLVEFIADAVQTETYYLFGLALFCYMDEDRDAYRKFVVEILMGGQTAPRSWLTSPMNFEHYYGNERTLWCASLIAHFASSRSETAYHAKLVTIGQRYRLFVKSLFLEKADDDAQRTSQNRLKHVWDGFVRDLVGHEPKERQHVIRYLHSILIEPRQNHIFVIKDPKRALDALNDFIVTTEEASELRPDARSFSFQGEEFASLKRTLEDAIHASATLEGIAESVGRLFSFHAIGGTDVTRYVAGLKSRTPGFRRDVHELRRLFQKVRDDRKVTRVQVRQIEPLRANIEEELTLSDSLILQALKWYIVPFQPKLKSAMEQADLYLGQLQFPKIWVSISSSVDLQDLDHVLIDPTLLKDILWNMCTNVRHGMEDRIEVREHIRIGIEHFEKPAPLPETDEIEYVRFWIESPLKGHEVKINDTIITQQLSVAQYGGRLEFDPDRPNSRVRVTLDLISRNRTFQRWSMRFPDNRP